MGRQRLVRATAVLILQSDLISNDLLPTDGRPADQKTQGEKKEGLEKDGLRSNNTVRDLSPPFLTDCPLSFLRTFLVPFF